MFTDRVLVTLAVLRLAIPHPALAVLYGVDRPAISRAVAGPRLHTLAGVAACAAARGVRPRVDGSEIQVRRPRAGRPGRRAFVSGRNRTP